MQSTDNNSNANFSLFETPTEPSTSYVLTQLEVYNWGPFSGLHSAAIDPRGTSIIGPTGSGKTTLIDALMTLLVEQPRYNLASTGGHESDRSLFSYVRGVLGGDGAEGAEAVARPAKTLTGICATYSGGEAPLKLATLLWTDGSSNAAQDLKRRWIFSEAEDQGLEQWLTLLHEGSSRELMKHGRNTGRLRIFESKKSYLAHARKFFDVGDNAFTLLNRAAGLKQLNSIDEIFRELVLEDRSAFDRAIEVATEFDNLADIHKELEIAKRQQESLTPVDLEYKKLLKAEKKSSELQELKALLPVWYAINAENLWAQKVQKLGDELRELNNTLHLQTQNKDSLQSRVDALYEQFLQLGGNVKIELQKNINAQQLVVAEIKQDAGSYIKLVKSFELDTTLNEVTLLANQSTLSSQQASLLLHYEQQEIDTLDARAQLKQRTEQVEDLNNTLQQVKARPGSNIPPNFQDFRFELATELGIAETALPFLAELVEVKAEESPWRGAIERAIGPERLRLLVAEEHMQSALQWVNQRHNKLHVRLQSVSSRPKDQPQFWQDGFCRKLHFKQHALREAAKSLVASRDRHCVETTEALRSTQHAMTIQGTMSGRSGQFEKQDQRNLQDNWMTGFDNKNQLESLARQLENQRQLVDQSKQETDALQKQLKQKKFQLDLIDNILNITFSKIDLPGAENTLNSAQLRLELLSAPDSDSSKAEAASNAAKQELETLLLAIKDTEKNINIREERQNNASTQRQQAAGRIGDGLTKEQTETAKLRLSIQDNTSADAIAESERSDSVQLDEKIQKQFSKVADVERRLITLMGRAQQADTGALTEVGTDLSDIPDYLERLKLLNEEALPEKTKRFLEYLNRSSDQGMTQLLSGISEEVEGIERRIAELNETLNKVDFKDKRYLQLLPQRIKHERLRTMETAQRKLRSAALKEDQGESHYKALRELVDILRQAGDNRRQTGSRALLDPRYRLQFSVVEVNRENGQSSAPRTGSQSGSGGEKELMASHILTASLSYALCPAHANQPLYGTVVLDEAFSKSSPSAASRIIEALRIFNLHPIFVTPNKEIGLLKKHTRKVICVHRRHTQSSLASITWEELDDIAASRITKSPAEP